MWYPKTMRKLKVFGYGVQKLFFEQATKKANPNGFAFYAEIKLITVSSL